MDVPALDPDAIVTVVAVTIMTVVAVTIMIMVVVMVMMAIGVRAWIVEHAVKGQRLQRRIVAPAQPQQRRFVQLPHLFFLALAEIIASLAMSAARGLALRHLIRVLLFESLSLAGKLSPELITPYTSLTCIE
jgi:hypothetical protein